MPFVELLSYYLNNNTEILSKRFGSNKPARSSISKSETKLLFLSILKYLRKISENFVKNPENENKNSQIHKIHKKVKPR